MRRVWPAWKFVAVIWTLIMPTYCVTARGIQLPWVTLSVQGQSASPPNSSIKRVSPRYPSASCLLAQTRRNLAAEREGGRAGCQRRCQHAVCFPVSVPLHSHLPGSLQGGNQISRGEQWGWQLKCFTMLLAVALYLVLPAFENCAFNSLPSYSYSYSIKPIPR